MSRSIQQVCCYSLIDTLLVLRNHVSPFEVMHHDCIILGYHIQEKKITTGLTVAMCYCLCLASPFHFDGTVVREPQHRPTTKYEEVNRWDTLLRTSIRPDTVETITMHCTTSERAKGIFFYKQSSFNQDSQLCGCLKKILPW